MKRKIILYSSIGVTALTILYIFRRRHVNKKLTLEIHRQLDNRINATGTLEDYGDVFTGTTYINKVAAKFKGTNHDYIKLKDDYVRQYAADLNRAMVGLGTDEDAIYETFNKLQDMVAIAQIAKAYLEKYKKTLYDHLKSDMTKRELNKISEIVMKKYPYRLYK
jgi:hypothetical protein